MCLVYRTLLYVNTLIFIAAVGEPLTGWRCFFFLYNNISILTCGVLMFFRAGVILGARATENTLSIIPFVLLFIHVMYSLLRSPIQWHNLVFYLWLSIFERVFSEFVLLMNKTRNCFYFFNYNVKKYLQNNLHVWSSRCRYERTFLT